MLNFIATFNQFVTNFDKFPTININIDTNINIKYQQISDSFGRPIEEASRMMCVAKVH